MDNLNNRTKSKKLLKSVLIIFLSCVILAGLFWGWTIYDQWRGQKKIQEIAEGMQKAKDEWYKMQMADTYGGKTPQETLNMYIDAVEKGDYELASKYFVIEKQEEELQSLRGSQRANIENVMGYLKEVTLDDKLSSIEEMYHYDVKEYHITESKEDYIKRISQLYAGHESMSTKIDGYSFSVDFLQYPNNIWKIAEI